MDILSKYEKLNLNDLKVNVTEFHDYTFDEVPNAEHTYAVLGIITLVLLLGTGNPFIILISIPIIFYIHKNIKKKKHKEYDAYKLSQDTHNQHIDSILAEYCNNDVDGVLDYFSELLALSEYPNEFLLGYTIFYDKESKLLLIKYQLPTIDDVPNIKEVYYLKTTGEKREKLYSQREMENIYDSVIYQISLRILKEILDGDFANLIDTVVFNGHVNDINPTTGHRENNCIISVQTSKDAFNKININGIIQKNSYKECFKALKGISTPKLFELTPVVPVININMDDNRFIENENITANLDDSINLASMDWRDFEHLVREVFEKEFSKDGGEVKVTQSSYDGGVDAIAFDPDPIRGGKIVIQAKRYTNVVGVSAVRDLYGTILNEGANKGILITTSNYGKESAEFAKDKPITLLNGQNLLHLLEKHGHKAKIDLKEAKSILNMGAGIDT